MPATGQVIGTAVAFVWLGMVLAISFLEAPLKFRAPGITLPLGLGIGRLVFRALNGCEAGLGGQLLVGSGVGRSPAACLRWQRRWLRSCWSRWSAYAQAKRQS